MQVTLAGSTFPYKPSDDHLSRTSIEFAAFDGEVGNGILIIADPASSYNVATGRQALVEEGSVVLSDGFMLDQDRTRGFTPAVAREYSFGLADANILLDGFRISRRRPAETDYARVMFFAGEDGPTWDTTWVLNSSTITMPAKRYYSDGGWTTELIPDVISYTGKTLFLHDKADGSGRCLHYHVLTTGHTCGLAISDVIADSLGSATTFFPWEPQRTRTSIDLRNDVKGVDQKGRTSFAEDTTSETAHDADGLLHEVHLDVEATTQADLDAQVAAYLASQKDDLDTWTCMIGPLDEDALALIRVGDIITVTSTVMGLSGDDKRISHMTLTPVVGEGGRARTQWWMAALELGAPIRRRARVKSGLGVSGPDGVSTIPFEPQYPTGECASSGYDYTTAGTRTGIGLTWIAGTYYATSSDFMNYYGSGGGAGVRNEYPHAGDTGNWGNGGGGGTVTDDCVGTLDDIDYAYGGVHQSIAFQLVGPGTLTVESTGGYPGRSCGTASVITLSAHVSGAGTLVDSDSQPAGTTLTVTIPDDGQCNHYVEMNGTTFGEGWGFVSATWAPVPLNEPTPGQPVNDACFIGDGSATSLTTGYPYLPGSIGLLVNGLDWLGEVTETDPTTGDVDIAYALPLGATVCARYRAS